MTVVRLLVRRALAKLDFASSFREKCSKSGRRNASTATTVSPASPIKQKLYNIFHVYEDIVGLTEVKAAQNRVIEAEKKFVTTQEERRKKQHRIQQIQDRLREIHAELDKTHRGEDRHLTLITQEHALLREERAAVQEFQGLERDERDYFSDLSRALHESHEKERAQGERTKYWSIIGSICGATIGILGATINNRIRFSQLRDLVQRSSSQSEMQTLVSNLSEEFRKQEEQVREFLDDVRDLLGSDAATTRKKSENAVVYRDSEVDYELREVLNLVRGQREFLEKETKEIKALLMAQRALEGEEPTMAAVYIGDDVREIVSDSQRQLEWKMKINSLATVALVYGALAVAVPLIASFFKGP